jgi:hypothetical protein
MYRHFCAAAIVGASVIGCAASPPAMPTAPPPPSPTSAAPAAQPSTLSYGSVTTMVQRNKTTQAEILESFGGPNIATTESDGTEVWVYDRAVTETDIATQSKAYQGAVNLGVSFGLPHLGGSVGASAGMDGASGQTSETAESRTLTVIVKFNADKTVKDYSVRSTIF